MRERARIRSKHGRNAPEWFEDDVSDDTDSSQDGDYEWVIMSEEEDSETESTLALAREDNDDYRAGL